MTPSDISTLVVITMIVMTTLVHHARENLKRRQRNIDQALQILLFLIISGIFGILLAQLVYSLHVH